MLPYYRPTLYDMCLLGLNTGRADYEIGAKGSSDGYGGGGGIRSSGLLLRISSGCLDVGHLLLRATKLALGMHGLYLDIRKPGLSRGGGSGGGGGGSDSDSGSGSGSGRRSRAVAAVALILDISTLLLRVGKLSLDLHEVVTAMEELALRVGSLGWVDSGFQRVIWERGAQGRGGVRRGGRGGTGFYVGILKVVEPWEVVRVRNVGDKRLRPTVGVVKLGLSNVRGNYILVFFFNLIRTCDPSHGNPVATFPRPGLGNRGRELWSCPRPCSISQAGLGKW
jgi:hypothetical protein